MGKLSRYVAVGPVGGAGEAQSGRSRLVPWLASLALLSLGCVQPTVTRSYDGVPHAERFIHPAAYAAFARGAEAAALGELDKAIAAFEQSVAYDDANVAARAELIGLYCRKRNLALAERAYAQVNARDPEYAAAHYHWARCQTQRQGEHDALAAARRAVRADPEDERAVLLLAQQLVISRQHDEAIAWLRALLRRQPGTVAALTALAAAAEGKQPGWSRWARARQRRLEQRNNPLPPTSARPLNARIDEALLSGRLAEAHRLARRAGSPATLVALRALALGDTELAEREASLRLGADPQDFAARAVLALVLDQKGQSEQAGNLLYATPQGVHLDHNGRVALARLLARHVGPDGSTPWAAELTAAPVRAATPRAHKEATP